jgi:hypothetical protein
MSDESTDPGFSEQAHKAALKAQAAARKTNAKVDPWTDRALYAIKDSEYSAVIIGAIVVGLILFGVWISK